MENYTLNKSQMQDEDIKALLTMWNPTYRVFSINNVEIVSRIKEYRTLLHIPCKNRHHIYLHVDNRKTIKWFANLIQVPIEVAKDKET